MSNAAVTSRSSLKLWSMRGRAIALALVGGFVSALLPAVAVADGLQWSKDIATPPEQGTGTSFSTDQLSLMLPLQDNQGREEGLRMSAGLEVTRFAWSGADAARAQYYWLSVPMQYWQQRTFNGQLRMRLELGLMTDLDNIGTDSMMANGEIYWRQRMGKEWFVQGGLMVDRSMGDFLPRPMAAIAWKSVSGTEVLLGFPQTRLQTGWSDFFSTYLHIRPDGGVWREQLQGFNDIYDVRYRNWKMGVGAEFWWRGGIWLNAEVGQQRLRKITAYDSTAARVTANPADNNYWQAGVQLRF